MSAKAREREATLGRKIGVGTGPDCAPDTGEERTPGQFETLDTLIDREFTDRLMSQAAHKMRDLQEQKRDLLAACEALLPLAESYLKAAPSHPDNALLEDARAAISKAKGEA